MSKKKSKSVEVNWYPTSYIPKVKPSKIKTVGGYKKFNFCNLTKNKHTNQKQYNKEDSGKH